MPKEKKEDYFNTLIFRALGSTKGNTIQDNLEHITLSKKAYIFASVTNDNYQQKGKNA